MERTIDGNGRGAPAERWGVRTMYGGTLFRSRLEARWAAFFDLCRWPWHYEPIDLDGYIPDFFLRTHNDNLLVEVRPYLDWLEFAEAQRQIDRTSWSGEALVLGAMIETGLDIGTLRTSAGDWARAPFVRCRQCKAPSLIHSASRVHLSRFCGHVGVRPISEQAIVGLWRAAGNRVQWQPRGYR